MKAIKFLIDYCKGLPSLDDEEPTLKQIAENAEAELKTLCPVEPEVMQKIDSIAKEFVEKIYNAFEGIANNPKESFFDNEYFDDIKEEWLEYITDTLKNNFSA